MHFQLLRGIFVPLVDIGNESALLGYALVYHLIISIGSGNRRNQLHFDH
jgi:hypothetical protein